MEARIHISKIWTKMEEKDRRGKLKPFSFQYAKINGELVNYSNAVMTSIFSKGATVNIRVNDETKSFRKILIMRFNEFKVYI
jgi:hypothetical protein